jgi:uncharacterized protein YgbK (DUF1537 family)
MSTVLIVADDLTGAADSCLPFQTLGYQALVLFDLAYLHTAYIACDVLCIDTETRHATALDIQQKLSSLHIFFERAHRPPIVFKKIDSTLRGAIGEEIDHLIALGGFQVVVVAPAFPRQGRQTIHGIHYVNSIPIAQTEFAADPRFPIRESHLPTLLSQQTRYPVVHLHYETLAEDVEALQKALDHYTTPGPVIITCDTVSEADLQWITASGLTLEQPTLLVGSAGLAEQVALFLHHHQRFRSAVLVIAGSLSHTTREQVAYAAGQGIFTLFLGAKDLRPSSAERVVLEQQVYERIVQGEDVILSTQDESGTRRQEGTALEYLYDFLGVVATAAAKCPHLRGLVLVGGETAQHILSVFGASGLWLEGEVLPAIPASRLVGGPYQGLCIVTKAGGFGTPEALLRCMAFCQRNNGEER